MSKHQIHITHIMPALGFGGAERFVVDLVNHSDETNLKFSVIIFRHVLDLKSEIKKECVIRVVEKKGIISLSLFGKLKKELQVLKPDIVHTHIFGGDVWGRIAAKSIAVPVVTTEHSLNKDESLLKIFVKKCLRQYSDVYTSPSQIVSDHMKEIYKINKEIRIIRHGIDLKKFSLGTLNLRQGNFFKLLMLGRLSEAKGHKIALQALAKLKNYKWQLEIVGEGEKKAELAKLVVDLGLKERIHFLPFTHDVKNALERNQIFLMPSLWEGLGIAAMEAMAAGRVIIASRAGGLSELIKDGETGLLVKPNNALELADKILWAFENCNEAEVLARQAQKYAQENFSLDKMVQEYERIYQSLVQ